MEYSLTSSTVDREHSFLLSSICSPFVQYVQASSSEQGATTETTNSPITIYEENTATMEETSSIDSSPDSTLASSDIQDTNGSIYNEIYFEDQDEADAETAFAEHPLTGNAYEALKNNQLMISTLKKNLGLDYLLENFYKLSSGTGINNTIFNVKQLLSKDITIPKNASSEEPQILIFHTHSYETFADSRDGIESDTIVGVGDELTKLLEGYGYTVLHYSNWYHSKTAYSEALPDLERILKENPSIQVVIDLHRDGLSEKNKTRTYTTIDGVQMAKLMFFNGVSYTTKGPIGYLYNKNLQSNLAFSLQMKLYGMTQYPELTKKTFLRQYRYNMHVVERYSLVEVGDNNSTVAEAKAAMKPLADIINHTLSVKNNDSN